MVSFGFVPLFYFSHFSFVSFLLVILLLLCFIQLSLVFVSLCFFLFFSFLFVCLFVCLFVSSTVSNLTAISFSRLLFPFSITTGITECESVRIWNLNICISLKKIIRILSFSFLLFCEKVRLIKGTNLFVFVCLFCYELSFDSFL
jgi:hypothetical protein